VGNFYGPTGLVAAIGIGLLKIYMLDEKNKVQIIPSDYAANAVISMAWDVANNK
jgi:fatty acyl-CoA reductase